MLRLGDASSGKAIRLPPHTLSTILTARAVNGKLSRLALASSPGALTAPQMARRCAPRGYRQAPQSTAHPPLHQACAASRVSGVLDLTGATRKHHSAEYKIRIVLEELRGDESVAALCRREAIAESLYCAWSKEFLEAGKRRLAGDTSRAAKIFCSLALSSSSVRRRLASVTFRPPNLAFHL
jgi:transposase-like protein